MFWVHSVCSSHVIHTTVCTVTFNLTQLYFTFCRPCSGMAGERALWAHSTYRRPTSRRVSRSSVKPPTRQFLTARRPVSQLTSSVSTPLLPLSFYCCQCLSLPSYSCVFCLSFCFLFPGLRSVQMGGKKSAYDMHYSVFDVFLTCRGLKLSDRHTWLRLCKHLGFILGSDGYL